MAAPKDGIALTSISHPMPHRPWWRRWMLAIRARTWRIRGIVVDAEIEIRD